MEVHWQVHESPVTEEAIRHFLQRVPGLGRRLQELERAVEAERACREEG